MPHVHRPHNGLKSFALILHHAGYSSGPSKKLPVKSPFGTAGDQNMPCLRAVVWNSTLVQQCLNNGPQTQHDTSKFANSNSFAASSIRHVRTPTTVLMNLIHLFFENHGGHRRLRIASSMFWLFGGYHSHLIGCHSVSPWCVQDWVPHSLVDIPFESPAPTNQWPVSSERSTKTSVTCHPWLATEVFAPLSIEVGP